MPRCFRAADSAKVLLLAVVLALSSVLTSGCDYASREPVATPSGTMLHGDLPVAPSRGALARAVPEADSARPASDGLAAEEITAEKAAILDNVVKLIQTGALNPRGQNFAIATKNLNQFFSGTKPADYQLDSPAREFLVSAQLLPEQIASLESPLWSLVDARHVEDCMMYQTIATRVAGVGNDLSRVRRIFDWLVGQIQLAPAGSLGSTELGQAYARPYDVLIRGLATEEKGYWSERGWLFLSLCRQIGLDGGLITYTPPGGKEPVIWCTAILIDKTPYLFDTHIGLPVPSASGDGVATLSEAMNDPSILARLELPGRLPYPTTSAVLKGSPSKIGVLLDSSLRYFAPRMKLLQRSLAGKNFTILYRDPAQQRDHWLEALGPDAGTVGLWDLPMNVERQLFGNPKFVASTEQALFLFQPRFPLLYARLKQLRGEFPDAIHDYVNFRFAERALEMDRKTPIIPPVQMALDVYATYFLGTCHLEQNNPAKAQFFFEKTLEMLPEYGPGQPYFAMFRWGAQTNLARLHEAKGESAKAAAYYSARDLTTQRQGDLVRAQALVWRNPFAPPGPVLPAPPKELFGAGPQAPKP